MQQCGSLAKKDSNPLFRSPHHYISIEMVLSRLKAGGAGTTTKEKVTLQRGGFQTAGVTTLGLVSTLQEVNLRVSFES